MNIEHVVSQLFKIAKKLKSFEEDDKLFIEEVKSLNKEYLKEQLDLYENTEKINRIRYEFLKAILSKEDINIEKFEMLKNSIDDKYDTNILNSWNNFNIIFPVYYNQWKGYVREQLEKIHSFIRNIEGFSEVEFNEDKYISDFLGVRNFGCSRCWLAVYPKNKKSHKESGQFFMEITNEYIAYGFCPGSDMYIGEKKDLEYAYNIKDFSAERFKEKLKSVFNTFKIINTNYINYFWISASPEVWTVDQIRNGGSENFTAYNEKGNKRNMFPAFEAARAGDRVVFYQSAPDQNIVAFGEITQSLHKENIEGFDEQVDCISVRYIEDAVKNLHWNELGEIEVLKNSLPIKQGARGTLFRLTSAEYGKIYSICMEKENTEEELIEVSEDIKYQIPSVEFNRKISFDNLYFENKDRLLRQITTALKSGKNIILIGPPGTGKSKIAKEICNSYMNNNYLMTTATSDWSTFETIGGYRPDKSGNLIFEEGLFLKCLKDKPTNKPLNKWLIIDELNRADIDKAFGSIFSVLTGDEITLSFRSETGNNIKIIPQCTQEEVIPKDNEYIVPRDFRIIATMNTFDKASLYEMSYAFMRRFAFIPIPVPKDISAELVKNYMVMWNIDDRIIGEQNLSEILASLWKIINRYRTIGPAILKDIASYTIEDEDITSAIILYVLPQFEGLIDDKIMQFVEDVSKGISKNLIDRELLIDSVIDFFQIEV